MLTSITAGLSGHRIPAEGLRTESRQKDPERLRLPKRAVRKSTVTICRMNIFTVKKERKCDHETEIVPEAGLTLIVQEETDPGLMVGKTRLCVTMSYHQCLS